MSAESWRIVLVTSGRNITSKLLPVVSAEAPLAQVLELQGFPQDGDLGELSSTGIICFLDLITDVKAGLEALPKIVERSPLIPVVALVPASEPQLILQALRLGAKDFLTDPFGPEQFRTVMEKLASLVPAMMAELGRVYSIIPVKGGCGASTLAYNLAMQLQKTGKVKTLLADLDPITGTQAFQMKMKTGFSFRDILNQGVNVDADIWKGVVQSHAGIEVLLSPQNVLDGPQEFNDARIILEFARKVYDHVVADLGSAFGDWALSAVRASDETFLVTTNELPALQAAQRVMAYFESNAIPRQRLRLVINRFNNDVGLTQEMIETALQTEVYQVIPSDYEDAQRALLEGKPIQASSVVAKQIQQITKRLAGTPDGEARRKPAKAKSGGALSGLFSLFSRGT